MLGINFTQSEKNSGKSIGLGFAEGGARALGALGANIGIYIYIYIYIYVI